MTTTQIIESELDHIAKKRMRALAQGHWQKAADCTTEHDCLSRLRERIVEHETAQATEQAK